MSERAAKFRPGSTRAKFAKRLSEWFVSGWVIMNNQDKGMSNDVRAVIL